jgi:predicted ATPase
LGPLRSAPQREYTWRGTVPSDVGKKGEFVVDALLASRNLRETEYEHEGYDNINVEERVAFWLQKLGLVHSFSVDPVTKEEREYSVRIQKTPRSDFVSLADVGFGISQILPVLTLCYYVPKNSIILLEQPELHLHPKAQAGLADALIDAAKTRNLQIILESHSEHLLARLQRRMAELGVTEQGIDSENVALYFCEQNGEAAHLTPLQLNEFGYIINWPKDFFGDEMAERMAMVEAEAARKQRKEAA